jgi:serine/threonine-protein kinase
MVAIAADRNLLFGLLALQNGLINQVQLVAAFQAWTLDKARGLADHLVGRGDLDADDKSAVDELVARHIRKHGGDVEKSLAAIPAGRSTRDSLARVDDPDVKHTLARLGSPSTQHDDDRTATYAVGTVTSAGQRFRLLRPHARGGLGAIFVALDSELHREVALKQILEDHADDPTSRQRFLLEAEVTGGLEHPGIVPVYGLGTYDDGRPYYAMRFIRGGSLKEAIEHFHADLALKLDAGRRSLELRKLLRRFVDVCNAIDYAHSRGVLHRDIKPGNVIVGRHGETLVVDWGLAKATGKAEPGAEERTLTPSSASGSAETLPGSALGTPAYMSPEQARGELENLGPRSDVYSLGATLYCLLTGRSPQERDDIGELLRRVQRGDFPSPRQIDPTLDPALEAVCLKAMATNADERYASCRALADDVERWMADEPVGAYREPVSRRARRWMKRNRMAVATATAALLAGFVGLTAVLVVQTQAKADIARALASETRANAALADANTKVKARFDLAVDAIKTFHTGVSEDFLLQQDQFKELRDRLLKSAADFYGKLSASLGGDTALEARRALAASNFELAELTGNVGRKEDALAMHRATLAALEGLAAGPRAHTALKAEIGRRLTSIAILLEESGKADDALSTYRRSEAMLERLAGSDRAARALLAACRSRLGYLLHRIGKGAEALAVYKLARSDQEALAVAPGAAIQARSDCANTIQRIGVVLAETGDASGAETEFRRALTLQKKVADENPSLPRFVNRLAVVQNCLGKLLSETGRSSEAETLYRNALALHLKMAERYPSFNEFRSQLALTHNNLGWLLSQMDRPSEAEAQYRAALAIQRTQAADNPTITEYRSRAALSQNSLGLLLYRMGKPSKAEAAFLESLAIRQKLADDHPPINEFRSDLAASHSYLGYLFENTGKTQQAAAEYRQSLALLRKLADDNPTVTDLQSDLAGAHGNVGSVMLKNGMIGEAEAEFRACLAIYQKLIRDNPAVPDFRDRLASSHSNLGQLLTSTGQPSEAQSEFRKVLAIRQKLVDDNPRAVEGRLKLAACHTNLALVARRLGRPAEARDRCGRAIAICEELIREVPEAPIYRGRLATSLLARSMCRRELGDAADAAADAGKALALWDSLPERSGEEWFETACAHAILASLAGQTGSDVAAAEVSAEVEAAMKLLGKAVASGYRNAAAFRTEPALDHLREREDLKILMMDLAMPGDAFSR